MKEVPSALFNSILLLLYFSERPLLLVAHSQDPGCSSDVGRAHSAIYCAPDGAYIVLKITKASKSLSYSNRVYHLEGFCLDVRIANQTL